MLLDKTLFSLEDVRLVRKVSVNIDDFDLYAREAQRNYLRKVLGDRLYTAVIEDANSEGVPQTTKYSDLINGKVYENGGQIRFEGAKLYLCYVWLHLYMADSAISITPTGAKVFKDEFADHIESKKSYRNAEKHFIAAADGLEDPILKFLDANSNDYPEFAESQRIESAEGSNMDFKVIGQSYNPPSELYL